MKMIKPIFMKKKSQIKMCGALAFICMSIISCIQKPEGGYIKSEVTVPGGAVNYFENAMDFGFEGGEKVLSFKSNLRWNLKIANTQNGVQWLTIDQTTGNSGSHKVIFSADENNTYEDRSVMVQLITDDTIRTIRVNQKRMEAITLTSDIFEAPVDGGDIDVEVNYSADYEMTIPDDYKGWIHRKPATTRGLESSTITFTIDPSEEYEKREGKIFFKARDEEEVVTIYQAGSGKLILSQNEYNLTGAEQEFSIDVNSNFDFSIEMPEADWLKENTSMTRGMSSHTLKFKVSENDDYNARSAKIRFFDNNSKISETVVINQASIGAVITLDTLEYNVSCDKQDLDIDVKSNFDYDIDFQGATWVKQRKAAKTRGITSRLLQLSVDENDGIEKRTAKIKLYDKKSSASIEVILNQLPNTPTIIPEKKEYEVDANKQNLDIKISSNVDYSVDLQGADWIKDRNAAQTRSLATSTLKLEIAKNDGYDSRTAKIKLTQKNGNASEEITITQKAKNGIEIPTTDFTVDEFGGTIKVVISSNIDYKFTINNDWIKQASRTRGLESHEHILTIDALGDAEDRTGTITVSNENMKFSKTITINQRHSLSFDKAEIDVLIGKEYKISLTNLTDDINIEWSSSDTSIATVNNNGIVKGVSKGEATITAKTADGKHTATCKVTVSEIKDLINVYNSGGVVSIVDNMVQYGSKLNWTFSNGSPEKVILKSLQLIDGQTNEAGNEMSVNKDVKAGTTVNYSTTIGVAGIHLPVTCRYKFEYDGVTYTKDAKYEGTSN